MAAELDDLSNYQNFRSSIIHGDRSQMQREYALNAFKTEEFTISVAPSIASRGSDTPRLV